MPIEVVHSGSGDVVEFPDGTPDETISRVMRQMDQETDARNRAGGGGVGANIGAHIGRLNPTGTQSVYNETIRRRARERAPRGRPGSLERGLEDFNRNGPAAVMDQMWRNIGVADEVAGAFEYLRSGGNADAAQAGIDYERQRQRQVEREQPMVNAASIAASVPATAGSPGAVIPRMGASSPPRTSPSTKSPAKPS